MCPRRRDAFSEVLRLIGKGLRSGFILERLLEPLVGDPSAHGLFEQTHRLGTLSGEGQREFSCGRFENRGGDAPMNQSDIMSFRPGEGTRGEEEFGGAGSSNEGREERGSAEPWMKPQPQEVEGDSRIVGNHAEVAGQHEASAGTHRGAMHRSHGRKRAFPNAEEFSIERTHAFGGFIQSKRREILEHGKIAARAEGTSSTGNDDHAKSGIAFKRFDALDEGVGGGFVQGVQPIGTIEDEVADGALSPSQKRFFERCFHAGLMLSMRGRGRVQKSSHTPGLSDVGPASNRPRLWLNMPSRPRCETPPGRHDANASGN